MLSQGSLVSCSLCWSTEVAFPISSNFRNGNRRKDVGLVININIRDNWEITLVDAGADHDPVLQWCPWCSPWSSPCAGRTPGLLVHRNP